MRVAMSAQRHNEHRRPAARLYLVTPAVGDARAFVGMLAEAIAAADVAAVLLRLAAADERTLIERVKALCPIVQGKDVALILDGHADIVARAGADGSHLTGIDAFNAAVATLKPARIAGCGGLKSRHDAMLAAEAGADYVMFGEPDAGGRRPPFAAVADRVAWWAEVFEPPCVGYAGDLDEAGRLAMAGADFVALGEWIFSDADGAVSAIRAAAQRLAATEPAR
jgi:thiamine-phosphate pyrophosphorylase